MLILLAVFFIMVAYHARLVEVTSRLDFLWKQQAERELADMRETQHNNTQLLKNILPVHVARHFLTEERQPDVRMIRDTCCTVATLAIFYRNYIHNHVLKLVLCSPVSPILLNSTLKI